jgi:hypothetical protein
VKYLLSRPETRSVFAYTYIENYAERRALTRAGLQELGLLPQAYYRLPQPDFPCVLFATTAAIRRGRSEGAPPVGELE